MGRLAFAIALLLLLVLDAAGAQDALRVQGRVVDLRTEQPVRGARVVVPGESSALTDQGGRFSLTLAPRSGPLRLQVLKPGFAQGMFIVSPGTVDFVVPLRPGGTLIVRVLDEFNEPKRGSVSVAALPDTGVMMSMAGTLDERGELRVPNLAPGRYRVQVGGALGQVWRLPSDLDPADVARLRDEIRTLAANLPPGQHPQDFTVEVRAGDETALVLADAAPPLDRPVIDLTAGRAALTADGLVSGPAGTASLHGRVTGADGRPIANARISVAGAGAAATVATDKDGRYTLNGLPAGTFGVRVNSRGFVPLMVGTDPVTVRQPSVTLQDGERRALDALMSAASTVSGTVLDEYGDPMQGANVVLLRAPAAPGSSLPMPPAGRTRTDERGRYAIRGVPPGDYYAFTSGEPRFAGEVHQFFPGRLSLAEAIPVSVDWGADLEDLNFRIDRALGARVKGTALDEDGSPLAGRAMEMSGIDAAGFPVVPRFAATNRAGAFEFGQVPPGEYELSIQPREAASPIPALLGLAPPPDPSSASATGTATVRVGASSPPPVVVRVSREP